MNKDQSYRRFLFDSEAVERDLGTVPSWRIDVMHAYGCADLWPIQDKGKKQIAKDVLNKTKRQVMLLLNPEQESNHM